MINELKNSYPEDFKNPHFSHLFVQLSKDPTFDFKNFHLFYKKKLDSFIENIQTIEDIQRKLSFNFETLRNQKKNFLAPTKGDKILIYSMTAISIISTATVGFNIYLEIKKSKKEETDQSDMSLSN